MTRLAVLLFSAALLAGAQEKFDPAGQTVVAHGEAIVNARPDQARVQLGVATQAQVAQAAATQNASQTAAVVAEVKKVAAGADIKTVNYSVYPNYSQPKDGRPVVITGYTANNTVEITLTDLALVGRIIDAGIRAGANTVQGVQFTLRDEQKARAEALGQAAKQARANADALAAALGMRIRRLLRVEDSDSSPPVMPMQRFERAAAMVAADTPVEPGNIQIRATVRITAELTAP